MADPNFMGPVPPIPQLIDPAVQANPMVKAMQQYLAQRNALPIYQQKRPEDGSEGIFQYGDDYPPQGQMTLKPGAGAEVYPHELSHAVMRQLTKQFYEQVEQDRTWNGASNPQFLDAYNKLFFRNAILDRANKVDPAWVADHADYRASGTEAPAWAVGNMVGRQIDPKSYVERGPSHVDSNMAGELAILLELASRKQPGKQP